MPGETIAAGRDAHSLTTAMTIPAATNTTIRICIQIQTGDIVRGAYLTARRRHPPATWP